ncbi:MAG: DUF1273 family protein [Clostridia bacterium]|nr:DUF1273 family protein [Clostridia bacterium]
MKEKTCCFTGHRDIQPQELETIKQNIEKEVIALIKNGVTFFLAGGAIGFDTLAAKTVLSLKETYPHIQLHLVLPCAYQAKSWSEQEKIEYENIKAAADSVKILSETYYRGCMQTRNRVMVDNSCFCICFCRKDSGGTAYTVSYAVKKGVSVIHI